MSLPFAHRFRVPLRTLALLSVCAIAALLTTPAWLRASALLPSTAPEPFAEIDTGHEAYAVTDLEWIDSRRDRRVPAKLFWPAAAAGRPVPLVIFSHGIGSSRDGYTYLGRYWAGHGIASLHVQHVGSDRALWEGSVASLVARFRQATDETEAIARVEDLRYALDRLLESERGAQVARDRIAAAGHSYGATTTLLAAGAAVHRDGRLLQFRDPRIGAAILISSPPFYGETDFVPILSGIHIPTLHITTAEDVIRLPGFGSGPEDRLKVFDATGSRFKTLAVYRHGSHNVFTDRRYFDSRQVAAEVKAATQSLSLAFLEQAYGTDGADLEAWGRAHRTLFAQYIAGSHGEPTGTIGADRTTAARFSGHPHAWSFR